VLRDEGAERDCSSFQRLTGRILVAMELFPILITSMSISWFRSGLKRCYGWGKLGHTLALCMISYNCI
jgi:hypothetical protein